MTALLLCFQEIREYHADEKVQEEVGPNYDECCKENIRGILIVKPFGSLRKIFIIG